MVSSKELKKKNLMFIRIDKPVLKHIYLGGGLN